MAKKQPKQKPQPAKSLRQRAEEMLRTSQQDITGMPTKDVHALVHELQVHQMELEIQNEELREAQVELAGSRDRYSDLYEFAPVGYLTLTRDGTIQQANLRAADMLAVDRRKLIGKAFSDFVDRDGQDQWHMHRQAAFGEAVQPSGQTSPNSATPQVCELPLRTSQRSLWARLESTSYRGEIGEVNQCRMALSDVTERKQAEQALRESDDRLRRAASAARFGSYSYDFEADTTSWSPELYALHGLSPDEPINLQRIEQLVHPDDQQRFREFVRGVIESTGEEYHIDFRVVRDGQVRWMADRGKITFSGQGEQRRPLRAEGMVIDITDRKRAEERIREINETLEQQVSQRTAMLKLLQDVTRAANEARSVDAAMRQVLARISQFNGWQVGHVWRVADDGSGELVNSDIWHLADNAVDAIEQLHEFQQFCQQTRFSAGQGIVGEVLESGEPKWVDDVTKYDDWQRGRVRHLGLHAAIAFPVTVDGQIVAVLEFFSDHPANRDPRFMEVMPDVGIQLGHVIARERAASSLRASEERHRAVLNAAPDAIVSTDRHGVIANVNPATERIFGYGADELIGRNVSLLTPSPFREEHDGYIADYLETRQPRIIGVEREVLAQCKNGRVFPIRLSIYEIEQMGLFVGIAQDLSQQKALEKQVVDAAADEQRRIGQDIHDGVGQELTGLRYMAQTHAETLAEYASPESRTAERMTEWLATVQGQLRSIIRELIPVEIDRQGLVAALRGLAERTTEVHDLVCSLECQQAISVADASLAMHVYRIAQEAVGNAVQHAQASQVRIQLVEDQGALTLQVIDDGVGIRSTPEKSDGVGLRSMAYRAGLIGARLDYRRGKGGGTQVTCSILPGGGVRYRMVNVRSPATNDGRPNG